jgi:opacity protein-like surface antigen
VKNLKWLIAILFITQTGIVHADKYTDPKWVGNYNAMFGTKVMNVADWQGVDHQGEIAAMLDVRGVNWPISLSLDVFASTTPAKDDPNTLLQTRLSTFEVNPGLKFAPTIGGHFRPYIGGGLSIATVRATVELVNTDIVLGSVSETGAGYWFGGGIMYTFGPHFNIGVHINCSNVLIDNDIDAGGLHGGLVLGYHFEN